MFAQFWACVDAESSGRIIELETDEWGHCAPQRGQENGGMGERLCSTQGKIRKVVDFRLLDDYSNTWRSEFPSTTSTPKLIPAGWNIFTTLDLKHSFYHIAVDVKLKSLFCFETNNRLLILLPDAPARVGVKCMSLPL